MASNNKQILTVSRNQIVLHSDLIPKDVTMFEYECNEDGRIVLTPFPAADDMGPDQENLKQGEPRKPGRGQLIDFRTGQALQEKRRRKKGGSMAQHNPDAKPVNKDQFVMLHHFPSRLEAEMVAEILRQGDIPFLIQSEDIGLFGPSAAPAPGGARLVVRQADLEGAKALLSGLI